MLWQRKNKAKIGYARVSKQDPNLELQVNALEKAGCRKIFRETAGGSYQPRAEFKRLLDEIRPGDEVVVWKLDHMARSMRDLVNTIEHIKRAGCGFQSLLEPWANTTTHGGETVNTVVEGLVEFERKLTSERICAGRKAAKERGAILGRPRKLNPDQVQTAVQLLAEGKAIREVASTFHVHETTIYRLTTALLEQ